MQNKYLAKGMTIANSGGLYTVALDNDEETPLSGMTVSCSAKGVFRHREERLKVGDRVTVSFTDHSFIRLDDGTVIPSESFADVCIAGLLERKNTFIRPPVSNIDYIFIVLSARSPKTDPLVADKLISIAEFNHAEPIVIVSKSDLDKAAADELFSIYNSAGFRVFCTSSFDQSGVDEVRREMASRLKGGKIAAFAGASGVGKSTMINSIFPEFGLATNDVSRKTERGRHTTRAVTLYPAFGGYIADTPGFSMLDFEHFDFFDLEDLADTFRDFTPYLGNCRYSDCTHTKEEECGIMMALKAGKISKSRHDSYLNMYATLKQKPTWKK